MIAGRRIDPFTERTMSVFIYRASIFLRAVVNPVVWSVISQKAPNAAKVARLGHKSRFKFTDPV